MLSQDSIVGLDMHESLEYLNCIKGKNGTTPFLPLNSKKGGPVRCAKDRKSPCLTEEQMRYVYKKVESGGKIKNDTVKQEIHNDKLTETKIEEEMISLSKGSAKTMHTKMTLRQHRWNSGLF